MDSEGKKEYLWRYKRAVHRKNRTQLEIEELRLGKMFPAGKMDGMPHGGSCTDLSGYAATLEKLEKQYAREKNECAKICEEIRHRIELLRKEEEKDVLMYRYIQMSSWEKIAEKMKKSVRRIYEIHGQALKHFDTGSE